MTHLELRLLGPPEVRADGDLLDFATRKTLALLAYLALEEGMQRRERLAALFWPESDVSRGRANVRNTLNYLRNSLPQTASGDTPHLLIERDTLGFNTDADYSLDLDTVAVAADLVARRAGDGEDEASALQAALDCYRGDFLQGFSLDDAPEFDQWATLERERWHRRIDAIFDRLAALHFNRGRLDLARETAMRWLEHDPLQETGYRRLMRLQLAAGERTAALQTYERCRETLEEEMGIAPAPETEALAARARKGKGRSVPAPAAEATAASDDEQPAPSFAVGPLVGREDHFASLVAGYHQAAQGHPQVVTVTGEAGIGKTRLAEEFLAWAAAQGADILRGRSFESGQRLPYQPLAEALRARVDRLNAPDDLVSDTWLLELVRLLPELLDRYPDLLETGRQRSRDDEAAARTRLFEAVTRLLLALARRLPPQTPLVLFVDDVQWADAASRDLLQYAGRRWQEEAGAQDGGAPLLLLLAVRAEALHPLSTIGDAQIVNFLNALERDLTPTTIGLETLTQVETEQFLDALLVETSDRIVQWLFRETAGQPFYLVETLKDLRERGALAAAAGGAWRLHAAFSRLAGQTTGAHPAPERVRQLIISRLGRLSPLAFDLLAAGAVLAQGFSFDLLCQVAAADEGPGLRALDELLRSQLLREVDGKGSAAGGPYLFAHDKIRDVVYTEAGDARRRIFHRRAIEVLAARDAPAATLAHHALAAGDREAAFRYSRAAGAQALAVYATQEAIAHYEKAKTLARDRLASLENAALEKLYLQLGRAYELAGDYEQALAAYDELQTLAQERGDRPLELAALMARTTVYAAPTQFYDPEHVAVLTEQALPLARELADYAAEAKILWNLMLLKLFTGELDDAVSHGEESLAIAREHDLRERMAYALHDLIRAYLFSGRPEDGIEAGLEAQALWRELGNKAMLADNLVSTSSALLFWRGDFESVLQRLEEAMAISREIDNLWNQSYVEHIRGSATFLMGQFGQAIDACEAAVRLGKASGFIIPIFANGTMLAWMYGTLGQPERGLPWIEDALSMEPETQLREQKAASLAGLAYIHYCRGELEEAEAAISRSYDALELRSLASAAFFTYPIDGKLKLAQGKPEEAASVAEDYFAYLEQTKLRPFRPDALYIKGRALLDQNQVTEARETLAAARAEAEALGAKRILWQILAVLAEADECLGNTEEAAAVHAEAGDIIRYLAAQVGEEELRETFLQRPAVRAVLDG